MNVKIFYNLQNQPTFPSEERLVNLARGRECFVGLSTVYYYYQVFRDHIQRCELASSQELEAIFSNITDIAELTMTLIGSLEDTLEMAEDGQITAIG